MSNPQISINEARQMDIVEYLEKLGYQPQKIRNNDYWYLSPLREENTASFKVNRKLNAWYDHGIGKGGNMINFGIMYHHCTIPELLEKLSPSFFFHRQTLTVQQPPQKTQGLQEALEPKIKVIAAKQLTSATLCRYLNDRKISLDIASKYCKEVDFKLYDKQHKAVGFENDTGGYELRNAYFKGSSSPKFTTLIATNPYYNNLVAFEGFFDFLSYKTLQENNALSIKLPESHNTFLVLNSLSFFEMSTSLMERHQSVELYLDRDKAGVEHTQKALQLGKKYVDRSELYKGFKDFNDMLTNKRLQQQIKRIGKRL
jgi:predicted DNA-binding protein YlxM (UPF0122 family)